MIQHSDLHVPFYTVTCLLQLRNSNTVSLIIGCVLQPTLNSKQLEAV